jgi:hypothetical protein
VEVEKRLSIRRFGAKLALGGFVWLATVAARGADGDAPGSDIIHDGSSNGVVVVSETKTNRLSDEPVKKGSTVEMVESNGMYSFNIDLERHPEVHPAESAKVERADEMAPASFNDVEALDVSQILDVYAKFTGAELDIGAGVREVAAPIQLKFTPAMTRGQVVDMLDDHLLKVGVVVTHPDAKHAVFRLKQ